MKKGERSFKINVFSGWMISYLAVLLIPLVLFFVFISVNTHLLTQQVTSYNRNAAALVSSVFDSVFQDINSFCDELLTDDDIEKLYSYQSIDSLTYYSSVQTMARLRGARYTISEALIFCPDLDSYVSSTRWGNIGNIYSLGEIRLEGWSVQDYQRVFSENYNSITLFDSSYELPSGKIQHKVLIVRPLSYAGLGIRNRYYLAALIDMDSLFSQTDSFNQYSNVLIYRSSTGNLLYSFNKDHSFPTVQSLDFAGKDVTVSTLNGRFSGLTYAVTSDNMVYFKVVRVQTTLAIVYFIAAIVLGFALIAIKTKKDWKRLNLAIEKTGTSAENLRGKDQYVPFISSVDILKKEKEGLSNLINTQTEEMKNTMIERLLLSNADIMVTEDSLRLCGIELISQLFMVLLTDTDDIDKAEKEITEIFDKTGINIYPFTSESGAAFLLNLSDSDDEQSCYNLVSDTIKTTNYASCSVASDLAKGIASIGNAYLDAINTLGYVKRKPVEAFVFHSDIVEVTRHINFSYPPEDELRLSNLIKEGNLEGAGAFFDEIVNKNLKAGVTNRRMGYLLFSIDNTILKVYNALEKSYGNTLSPVTMVPVLNSHNLTRSSELIRQSLCSLTENVSALRGTVGDVTSEGYVVYRRALMIVNNNFSDSYLNVSFVADQLGISIAYLSKLFKKYHNITISDYISRVRIDRAKEMLLKGESVLTICDKCGFGSQRTFLRVFKKMEDATPGEFKSLNNNGGK